MPKPTLHHAVIDKASSHEMQRADVAGVPRGLFLKEICRAGTYRKSNGNKPGRELRITHDDFNSFTRRYAEMLEAAGGDQVLPVVKTHDGDNSDPANHRGWVLGLIHRKDIVLSAKAREALGPAGAAMIAQSELIKPDSLYAVVELIGAEAMQEAASTQVSIGWGDTVDGKGNTYANALVHVAHEVRPLVEGMKPYIQLASKADRKESPVTLDNAKALLAKLGITADDLNDDNAFSKLSAAIDGKLEALKQAETKAASAAANTAKKSEPPDAHIVSLVEDSVRTKVGHLVEAGLLTPAARDKILTAAIGDKSAVLTASLTGGGKPSITVDALIEAMKDNKGAAANQADPGKGGRGQSRTGAQNTAAKGDGNGGGGDGESDLVKEAKRQADEHNKRFATAGRH